MTRQPIKKKESEGSLTLVGLSQSTRARNKQSSLVQRSRNNDSVIGLSFPNGGLSIAETAAGLSKNENVNVQINPKLKKETLEIILYLAERCGIDGCHAMFGTEINVVKVKGVAWNANSLSHFIILFQPKESGRR